MYSVDVYLRVRRAVMVEGRSIREVSREFGLHRDTVRKMLTYSVPPGYRRQTPPRRPKLEPFTGVIDRILEDDLAHSRKQRHTAKRIFQRLRDEYGFDGGYTTVKDYVREHRRQTREMFVPLSHAPGQAQCDFGEALVVTHIDRLSRGLTYGLQVIEGLHRAGVEFRSLAEDFDTATSTGKLQLSMVFAFSEWWRNSIRDRSVAGQAKARIEGSFPDRRPSLSEQQREYIRVERSKGVSQRELAKRLEVSRWTIQQVDG